MSAMFTRRAARKERTAATKKPWQDAPTIFWVKEFGAAATAHVSRPPAPGPPDVAPEAAASGTREKLRAILLDYMDNSYVAGVPFMARRNVSTLERWMWILVVCSGAVLSVREIPRTYKRLYTNPSTVDVLTTAKLVQSFPFPAIAVCPKMKIRKREAIKYLAEINGVQDINETLILPALEMLQGFRIPYLTDFLYTTPLHPYAIRMFAGIDLRDFMHRVSPVCDTIIKGCMWSGHQMHNCCSLFEPVLSNAGICYIFNSHFPTETRELCAPLPFKKLPKAGRNGMWYHQRPKKRKCILVRSGTVGAYSGAEIFMEFSDPEDMVSSAAVRSSGFEVVILAANEHVDVNKGVYVPETNRMSRMAVSYRETGATEWLRSLPPEQRECLFENEIPAMFKAAGLKWYTQEACIYVCRMEFLAKRCGCYPYLADLVENQCNLEEYRCYLQHSPRLFWVRTPYFPRTGRPWDQLGTTADERNASLWPDCRACLPLCSLSTYETQYESLPVSSIVPNHSGAAYLNVFHRDHSSAVQYVERRDLSDVEQLANYLFTLNLLLGVSIMSLVQIVLYVIEALIALRRPTVQRLARLRDACWRPETPTATPPRTPTRHPTRTPLADDVLPLPYVH